jgi:Ca2+-binding RTX toxin-like protein
LTVGADGNDLITIVSPLSNVFAIGGMGYDQILVTDSPFNLLIGDCGSIAVKSSDDVEQSRHFLTIPMTATTLYDDIGASISGSSDDVLIALTTSSDAYLLALSYQLPTQGSLPYVRSIMLGGSGSDTITSNGECTIQCGDQCSFGANAHVSAIADYSLFGGDDQLRFFGKGGTAMIIGGAGNDWINIEDVESDAILGDIGTIRFTSDGVGGICTNSLNLSSLPSGHDGRDTISATATTVTPSSSNDTMMALSLIIGGGASDTIHSNGSIVTAMFGDFGTIQTSSDTFTKLWNGDVTLLTSVASTNAYDASSNDDQLYAFVPTNSRTVMIGGAGHDNIMVNTHAGDIIACGDHCASNDLPLTSPSILFVFSHLAYLLL